MKKVKLVQQEEELLKSLVEVYRKYQMLKLEYDKKLSDFWYMIQSRKQGNYNLDNTTGEVWEKTYEELMEEQKNKGRS